MVRVGIRVGVRVSVQVSVRVRIGFTLGCGYDRFVCFDAVFLVCSIKTRLISVVYEKYHHRSRNPILTIIATVTLSSTLNVALAPSSNLNPGLRCIRRRTLTQVLEKSHQHDPPCGYVWKECSECIALP